MILARAEAGKNTKNAMEDNTSMNEVILGKGKIFGKGVYAKRDFEKGEAVIKYNLKLL